MGFVLNALMFLVPVVGVLGALFINFVYPTLDFLGFFRILKNTGQTCRAIPGLEACEAAYLDVPSGLLYLGCLPLAVRRHWTPAMLHLEADKIPDNLPGYFATYDTRTGNVQRLKIQGELEQGLAPHGFDFWVHDQKDDESAGEESVGPRKATLFASNHRKPKGRFSGSGADSVMEIFETEIGSDTLRHIKTFSDRHIVTPNNVMALSDSAFYVTNDHAKKTGLYRSLSNYKLDTEFLFGTPMSSITYCDTSKSYFPCSPALHGILYPNGIERGPDQSVYVSSTALGLIYQFGIQADHSLVMLKTIDVGRVLDNLNVLPEGDIIAAAFPVAVHLGPYMHGEMEKCPVEVYRITNATGSGDYYGGTEKVELIFADDGTRMSAVTDATIFEGKLYLTGVSISPLHGKLALTLEQVSERVISMYAIWNHEQSYTSRSALPA